MLYIIGCIILKPILWIYGRPKIHNRAALKSKGKVIYVSNHVKMSDPIWIAAIVWRCIHFMAKSTLFSSKFMTAVFRLMLSFPVNQRTADTKSIKYACRLLGKGKALGIFPEGHRSSTERDMDALDKGCAVIALRADAPIIPLYIVHHDRKFGQRLKVAVGDPIYPAEVKAQCPGKKPVDAVNAAISDAMLSLRDIAEAL
jgi:1-acyl-sn-glycerol-3-phosphate acyltransferase